VSKIRYHFDAHCPHAVANGLRGEGFDVTTALEVGLQDAPDPEHLIFARHTGRALFTRDCDFWDLHQRGAAQPHPGIVYCSQQTRLSIGEMILGLKLIGTVFDAEELTDTLHYLTVDLTRGF
jgi:predicted nuclease of predicted toxin-antitoxin system